MYTVLLYYKYVKIKYPKREMKVQRKICEELDLTGRIIVSPEGINGTVEGLTENTEKYIEYMSKNKRFADINWKKSKGTGNAFPKLSVKVRPEIVSLHLGDMDFDPNKVTGKYLTAEELHEWFETGKEFYIVDMRNDYEYLSGRFENSVLPGLENFRDLKKELPKLEHLKDKTVLTVCTGGVRCEKASGFLMMSGFKDVYQLKNGIVTYMEKYPNEHFKGKLYVFDGRVTMGFGLSDSEHEIIGRCEKCLKPSENYINCATVGCHRHFIMCESCLFPKGKGICPKGCDMRRKRQRENPANAS
jgi:UPF0176 protein